VRSVLIFIIKDLERKMYCPPKDIKEIGWAGINLRF